MRLVFLLLVIYQLKHWICDYPLQGEYMLGKFKSGTDWIMPLAAHCYVHMMFSLVILLYFKPQLWYLCFFDFAMHFVMDRVKASPKLLGRFKGICSGCYPSYKYQIDFPKSLTNETFKPAYEKLADEAKTKLKRNNYFWLALGADQSWHHLTHYAIIYMVVTQ